MTNAPDLDAIPPSTMENTPSPTPSPRRRRGAGHIIAIVTGCLLLLPALGILTGGAAVAIGQAVATDDDGYFNFTLDRVASDGVAVATTDIWFDDLDGDATPWVLDWLDLDLRVRAEGAATTDEVFVGIARSADVERYLSGAAFSRVVEIDEHTPQYRTIAGSDEVAPPADQDFWKVSAVGAGEQELTWDARGGRWSIVVMNADGSADIAADVELGAKSGALTPITVFLLVLGGLMATISAVLIVVGARGRRTSEPDATMPLLTTPLPPPTPGSAARTDADETRATPVG